MSPIARTEAQIRQKIAQLQQSIASVEYLASGTLLKRTKQCGNPRCRCANDPESRHGPYYEWSFLKGKKLRHRMLSPAQAHLMSQAITNYRKTKRLLRSWEVQTLRLIKLKAEN